MSEGNTKKTEVKSAKIKKSDQCCIKTKRRRGVEKPKKGRKIARDSWGWDRSTGGRTGMIKLKWGPLTNIQLMKKQNTQGIGRKSRNWPPQKKTARKKNHWPAKKQKTKNIRKAQHNV